MIIEGIFSVFFTFIEFLIVLLPFEIESNSGGLESFINLLGFGVYIIGPVTFIAVIGSFITWTTINMSWAVIEWIYKKIPGIN